MTSDVRPTVAETGTPAPKSRVIGPIVRRPWVFLGVVAVLVIIAGFYGWNVQSALVSGGYTPTESESARGDALLVSGFGAGTPNLVLLATTSGDPADPGTAAAGRALTDRIRSWPGVVFADSYWSSGAQSLRGVDGHSALIAVRLAGSETAAKRNVERLVPTVTGQQGPLFVRATGPTQVEREAESQSESDLNRAELLAAPLTLLILLIAFRSLVGSLLPLAVGVVAVVGTMAVLRVMASVTDVSVFALNITTALGFGLAVDYSLLIVTRFREELAGGRAVQDAVRVALLKAGRTVLFSAVTVALALAAMLVFPLVYLHSLAYAGIAVVLLAAVSALVVLGPMMALLGPNVNRLDILRPLSRRAAPPAGGAGSAGGPAAPGRLWYRIASVVMRRPLLLGAAATIFLVVLAIPFTKAQFATEDDRTLPPDAAAHVTADMVRAAFPGGQSSPLTVVLPGLDAGRDATQVSVYAVALSNVPGVREVDTATGSYASGRQVAEPAAASSVFASGAGTWLQVTSDAIPNSPAGERLVHAVRDVPAPGERLVSGDAAAQVDTKSAVAVRLPWAGLIILVTMVVLLFLFTGSVIVPVKAAVLGALSLTASFGAVVWIFQEGHLRWLVGDFTVTGELELTTPVLMFCIAFGLSMDYEVFLLSRIREEYVRTGDNTAAVAEGLGRTGRVVTAAAAVVTVVLGVLATSGLTVLKVLGLGLAIAVIVDATIVRGILLPATMRLLGRGNWWAPPPLRRLHAWLGVREP